MLRSGYKPVDYIHMSDAVRRGYGSPFSHAIGWTPKHIWELILSLADYMNCFKGGSLTMHSCEVDMNAWRKLSDEGYAIPSEVELCNRYVAEYIAGLFAQNILLTSQFPTIVLDSAHLLNFVFDRNESFIEPFSAKWKHEKEVAERLGKRSIWHLVDQVTDGEMKTTPGLQAADILAWGVNRQNTGIEGREGKKLAHILRQLVMCTWKEFDEATMRRDYSRG